VASPTDARRTIVVSANSTTLHLPGQDVSRCVAAISVFAVTNLAERLEKTVGFALQFER
jgi:hypothetical protein